jgi:hypothetical protein
MRAACTCIDLTKFCSGYEKMVSAAKDASDAIANVHGRRFEVNCIPCVQNPTSGAASDWMLGVIGAPYVYNLELRDKGRFGFLLPPGTNSILLL